MCCFYGHLQDVLLNEVKKVPTFMEGAGSFLPFLLKIISVLKVFKVFKAIKDNNANLLLPPFPPSSLFSLHHHLSFNFFNSPITSLTSHNSIIQTQKNSIPPNFG